MDYQRAAALALLDSPEARRLAAAWPFLGEDKSLEAWGRAAGVTPAAAQRFAPPLLAAGICKDDGMTEGLALQFIAARMTQGMAVKRAPQATETT